MKSFVIITIFLIAISKVYGLDANSIVAFGDSLTCNGNACKYAKKPAAICREYPEGRFTNGEIWLEHFADKLGLPRPTPSLAGGTNFAYAGASTGRKRSPHLLNVGRQIEAYLKRNKKKADPESLFVIWAGSNDIKDEILPRSLISNLKDHITTLAKAGAKNFLVPNFPPLGETPAGGAVGSQIASLFEDDVDIQGGINFLIGGFVGITIETFNEDLESMLSKLERSLDITIYRLDAYALFFDVKANPKAYGLSKNDHLFHKDGFHPSAISHKIIAEAAYNACQ